MIPPTLIRIPVLALSVSAVVALAAGIGPVEKQPLPADPADPAVQTIPAVPAPVPILANDAPSPLEPGGASATRAAGPTRPLSPLMVSIRTALAEQRARVTALSARLEKTKDTASALAIVKEIEQAKRDGELRLLEIQLDFARQAGREETAAQIADVIARMESPVTVAGAKQRPEPPPRSDRP